MAPTDQTGRNDPCPCGSGKKYKKCCLPKEKEARRKAERQPPGYGPVERALKWLEGRYPGEMAEALHGHLALSVEDAMERVEELPKELRGMVVANSNEWLIADGTLALDEGDVPVRELLLGPGGPLYDAEQRAWMEALTSRPLGLYEVLETTPGTGFRVRDVLHPEEPPIDVRERSASQTLVQWEILGLRLVPWKGDWLVAGSIYPLFRDADFPEFLRDLRKELAQEAGGDPGRERAFLSAAIPQEWLLQLLVPRELPEPVDAATGDPILLVTDHYRVRSWERLEAALAGQPDVEGGPDGRLDPLRGGRRHDAPEPPRDQPGAGRSPRSVRPHPQPGGRGAAVARGGGRGRHRAPDPGDRGPAQWPRRAGRRSACLDRTSGRGRTSGSRRERTGRRAHPHVDRNHAADPRKPLQELGRGPHPGPRRPDPAGGGPRRRRVARG